MRVASGKKVKNFFLSAFIAIVALAINTTGFDFYAHVESMTSLERIGSRNPFWQINGLKLPRYLLGHHLLFFLSFSILPIAWVVVAIHGFILTMCVELARNFSFSIQVVIGIFFAYIMVYMSMQGIGAAFIMLAILSYYKSQCWRHWIFLGAAFHPVSFCAAALVSLLFQGRFRSSIVFFLVLSLSFGLGAMYSLDMVKSVRPVFVNMTVPEAYLEGGLSRLSIFLKVLGLMVIFALVSKLINRRLSLPKLKFSGVILSCGSAVVFALLLGWEAQWQRGSLITYFFGKDSGTFVEADKNQLICAAWISRNCYYQLGDERGFSFRQEQRGVR
jgi:hypothetical protein